MEKVNKVILVLSFIFLTNYATAESDFNKEAIRFNNSVEAKGWQAKNPAAIFYRKNANDGMSWRKRNLNYDKSDTKLSKENLMSTIWKVDSEKDSSGILLFYSDDYFAIGSAYADIYLYDEMYNVSVESVKKGTVITTRARTTKLEEYDENKKDEYSEYSKALSAELKK